MRPWLVLLPLAVGCSLVLLWLSAAPSTSLSPANRSRGPPFDPGRDTFVLLHIQKTGGTAFASALLFLNVSAEFGCVHWNGSTARNWLIANPNEALKPGAFSCARQPGTRQPTDWNHPESLAAVQAQWLFSRPTTGWPCGAHTDLAHLLVCFDRWLVARANKNSTIPLGPASLVEVLREFAGPMPLPWIPQSAVGRLHIITILRNPVDRFLSEFLHTVTGWGKSSTTDPRPAFFVEADFHCDGSRALRNVSCRTEIRSDRRLTRGQILQELGLRDKSASQQALNRTRHLPNLGSETKHPDFDDVLLSEYLFCSHNDAINRQAKMLALRPCHGGPRSRPTLNSLSQEELVQSACHNLEQLPFVALHEFPEASAQLFAWTFGLDYSTAFRETTSWQPESSAAGRLRSLLSEDQVEAIMQVNTADMRTYECARLSFKRRILACESCEKINL
eukprot:m.250598 g.250598  ORF g.250598 m.250598 type:complete len:448 (-) comp54507_c0_seq41:18-1361(-)